MKFFAHASVLLGLLLSIPALASFSLSSVSSIQCSDADSTSGISIYFTTSDSAAQKYFRRDDDIPYDYGNRFSIFGDAQSGTLKLANVPETQNGQIVLEDQYDNNNVIRLVLTPQAGSKSYSALLSGPVETLTGSSVKMSNHRLNCALGF